MKRHQHLRAVSHQPLDNPKLYDRGADLSPRRLLALTDGLVAALATLWRPLPVVALTTDERRRLGGRLLPGFDGEIVERVALALRAHPQLFSDLGCDGDDLLAQQRVADRLDILRSLLRILLSFTEDLFLVVQGDAMRRTMEVLDQARDRALKAPPADAKYHHERLSALSPALSLLAEVRAAIRRRQLAGKAAAKQAAPDPAEQRAVGRRKLADLLHGLR